MNTTHHLRADLMFLYAMDAKTTDKPWTRWQKKVDGEWVQCESHPLWTMPNTDVHPLSLPLANTNSLKVKPNLLQSVRHTGTLLTVKTVDFMITKLDGKV
nr:MAG TPA: hypothetical protein [Caudoviricetes sp.]